MSLRGRKLKGFSRITKGHLQLRVQNLALVIIKVYLETLNFNNKCIYWVDDTLGELQSASRSIASVIVIKTQIFNFMRNNLVQNNHRNELHNNKMVLILQQASSESDCRRLSFMLDILFLLVFFLSVRRKPNCRFYVLFKQYFKNLIYFVTIMC